MEKTFSGLIDIHCHILPGLDDGSTDMATTIAMARQFTESGFTKVVATPHFIPGTAWNASRNQVLEACRGLQMRLEEEGIGLEVIPGMEIAIHPALRDNIEKKTVLPLGKSNFYLIEPSFVDSFYVILQAVDACVAGDIKIIIAHPERIPSLQKHRGRFLELLEKDVRFQVNIGSFLGIFGRASKIAAEYLLELEAVHLIGSDAHDSGVRPPPSMDDLELLQSEYGIDMQEMLTNQLVDLFNH